MEAFTQDDRRYMGRALALARRGMGKVEPNPMVGAVVVAGGEIVGEGFHERYGGNHAEVHALLAAGKRTRGATLYVTLEPCCHWGKTPPCTEAILHTGIKRVVVAMIDPFVAVSGNGVAILRAKDMRVDVGLMEAEARALNGAFITRLQLRRPWVIAKWAQSVDGCVATASGESKWISSKDSREFVQRLRGRVDGILIGINTALLDDPLLTARPTVKSHRLRTATRIVLDSQCRLPVGSQLVRTVSAAPLLVVHGKTLGRAAAARRRKLAENGAMMLGVAGDKSGRPKLAGLMKYLADHEYANILLEGGPEVVAAFLRADLVDEAHVFVAPIFVGGHHAVHAVGGEDLKRLKDAHRLRFAGMKKSGPDVHLALGRFGVHASACLQELTVFPAKTR